MPTYSESSFLSIDILSNIQYFIYCECAECEENFRDFKISIQICICSVKKAKG